MRAGTGPSRDGSGLVLDADVQTPVHGGAHVRVRVLGNATDLPLASASSDMIGWSRVLLSHTLDAPRSY